MTARSSSPGRAAVLAVDGGNSKTDVVLLDRRGRVVGAARGPGSNHSHSDHQVAMGVIDSLVAEAVGGATESVAEIAMLCLAGADYPSDARRLAAGAARFRWANRVVIHNDAIAMLRAGTDSDAAIALVCGAGVNCAGVAPGGRRAGFPALGEVSGDWGGGYDIGMAALVAAIRAQDGRGPRTSLARSVPAYFGLARPSNVVFAMHSGGIDQERVTELPPLVFAAADAGDQVALRIIDRLAAELVTMVGAIARRLRLTRLSLDVVLGGGVLAAGHPLLYEPLTDGILRVAPEARLITLTAAPVAGAALLALDELGISAGAGVRPAIEAALATKGRP